MSNEETHYEKAVGALESATTGWSETPAEQAFSVYAQVAMAEAILHLAEVLRAKL
jgi:hypothetical protein